VKFSDDDLPGNLAPYIEKIDAFHKAEVAPREKRLEHRLTDSRAYLGDDGRLHPEVQQARREIMKASGAAGLFSLHLPESIDGGGLSRTEMFFIEEKVYSFGVGLGPAILGWTDGSTPRLIYCSEAQRGRFVDPLVRGEKTSCHGTPFARVRNGC
jgi:acyl-CoA dehydrogenase